jgi:hypothetical protein
VTKETKSFRASRLRLLAGLFLSGALLLTFSIGVSAQYAPEGVKGLYSAGKITFFWTEGHQFVAYAGGSWTDGQVQHEFSKDWQIATAGSLGGCVFDSALYAFFTTTGGELWYLKTNPSNGDVIVSPTKIAGGVEAHGAAAAVVGNEIYVFTTSSTFRSKDGSNFAVISGGPDQATDLLDAVTFYPPDDAPPLPDSSVPSAVMVVYLNGENIQSEIFQGSGAGFGGQPMTLPNPLDYPVEQGNCILGTSQSIGTPGAKDPCIQFYGCTVWSEDDAGSYQLGRWEYDIKTGQWSAQKWISEQSQYDAPGVGAAPWSEVIDTNSNTLHLLQIVWDFAHDRYTANDSDYEVPMYNDSSYGWEGVPTPTSGATSGTDLANLWTLVGVVLGPPPFAMNALPDACPSEDPVSWVDYGKDTSTTVSTTSTSTSTISVASETKIEGGLGEASLDLSYAHAWTHSKGTTNTVSVSQNFTFSPCQESGTPGLHGWVIFDAPTLVTQQYKIYAYDYQHSNGSGTYLGQSIYTTVTGEVVQQLAYFDLANPSGSFEGIPAYPDSTDYVGWSQCPDWSSGGSDWSVTFGDTTSPQMPVLSLGGKDEVSYAQSDTKISSTGNSNSFGVKLGGKLQIEGFSESLSVGYDGEWSTETSTESTITTSVTCGLNLPIPPGNPGYVTSLTVQPYWLQAKTYKAPWIPSQGYNGDLPWCITWAVKQYQTGDGGTAGTAAEPESASGTIRHGMEKERDHYTLTNGRLNWQDSQGLESPIPMTADQFDPSKGASVSLNGHLFPANCSKGKWVRKGNLWKYRTREWVKKDPFVLELDFAGGTWSFDASSKNLDQEIKTAEGGIRVELAVQGSYCFGTWLYHDVESAWNHAEKKADWQPYGVHEVDGTYNSRTGQGTLKLKGHIPKNAEEFGDLEIRVNGSPVRIPLLSVDGFLDDLDGGGVVKYETDGLTFRIDFGTGKWKAMIEGARFQGDMAPKQGAVRVQVLVGGGLVSDQTLTIQKYVTNLAYGG